MKTYYFPGNLFNVYQRDQMKIGCSDELTSLWLHTNVEHSFRKASLLNIELSVNALVSVDGKLCGASVVFAI